MAAPTETADQLIDRADRFMYASKRNGRNRITTDTGELTNDANRPIVGACSPWEMRELNASVGFGSVEG